VTTSNVDFFYHTKTQNEDVSFILSAAKKASQTLGLEEHWLNNQTALFMQVLFSN
jgi:hypothetical protein